MEVQQQQAEAMQRENHGGACTPSHPQGRLWMLLVAVEHCQVQACKGTVDGWNLDHEGACGNRPARGLIWKRLDDSGTLVQLRQMRKSNAREMVLDGGCPAQLDPSKVWGPPAHEEWQ